MSPRPDSRLAVRPAPCTGTSHLVDALGEPPRGDLENGRASHP
jgi:hypothetical protein